MKPQTNRSAVAVVGCLIAAALAVCGALIVAFVVIWNGMMPDRAPPRPGAPAAAEVSPGKPGRPALPASPQAARDVDYFRDASSVPVAFTAKVPGGTRLLELSVYPTYAFAEIQDPKKKENVDRYTLRDGDVDDGEPVRLIGPVEGRLESSLFDLTGVDFGAVPRMAADALAQLQIEDGKVSHMILRRGIPFNKDVRWRVYVSGARKSGSVEYDPAGRLKKVWR